MGHNFVIFIFVTIFNQSELFTLLHSKQPKLHGDSECNRVKGKEYASPRAKELLSFRSRPHFGRDMLSMAA